MSKSVAATDYTRMRKAQLIEKLRDLEREVERLVQTGSVETTTGGMTNDDERRFRDFAEIASDWFWESDEHLRFTYFSGRHDDIGLEIKKTLGKTRPEVTIEDTVQKKWLDHLAVLAARKPFKDFRYASYARDGRVIQLAVSGKPIFDEAGNFKGYRGTGTDISALAEAENELQHSEARFRDFAETASDWFWEMDENLRFSYISDRFEESTGIARSEVIGCSREGLYDRYLVTEEKADSSKWSAHFELLRQRKSYRNLELRWRCPDGSEKIFLNSGDPVFDAGGEFKGYRGSAIDITELKRAEEETRDSRDHLRLITDSLPVLITYFDTDQRTRFANKTAQEWYGCSVEDILGRTTAENVGSKAHAQLMPHLEAALSGKEQRFGQIRTYPDGRTRAVATTYVPHFRDNGEVQGCFALVQDITEFKKIEEALRKSEAQIRGIMDNAPIEIVLKDTEGHYVLTNAQWQKNYNLTDEQAKGKTLHDFFPEEFAKPLSAHDREVMATGEAATYEDKFPESDGVRDFLTIAFPIRDTAGGVINIGAMAVDITERKRAEEALRESEGRFRDIAQASGDWFWETDAGHRFTWLSDRAEHITGVPVKYHIGKSRLELAADQVEQDKWRAHIETLEAQKPFRDFRYLRRGHDGRLQHLSSSGVPVFDIEGNFTGYRGTGTDISAVVNAKEMAASAHERFMAAIESVSDGFALFDAEDRMVFCNNRFKEMNPDLALIIIPGITFEEMLRDNIAASRILDALGHEDAFIHMRMEQHRNPSGPQVQQRHDGRWLELREERTPEGSTFLVNTDITERKAAEEVMLAAIKEAEIANRTKSEFLTNMSHELRTPLNAIIGFSDIIKDETLGPVENTTYRDYAFDINESGQHLLALINDILDLSKIESGTDELHEENVDIPEIANAIIKLVMGLAQTGNVKLELDVSDDIPVLRADERKVKQILLNLLSNAIKFTPDGGKVTLKIWSRAQSGYVFQVIDSGIGIAFEDIPKALAPFQQIDSGLNRKHEGTGLGLPLAKSLVEMHGGYLDLQSEINLGTTVTVRFPAERIVQSPRDTNAVGAAAKKAG